MSMNSSNLPIQMEQVCCFRLILKPLKPPIKPTYQDFIITDSVPLGLSLIFHIHGLYYLWLSSLSHDLVTLPAAPLTPPITQGRKRTMDEKKRDWVARGDLAQNLEAKIIGKVHLPLRINLLMLGLDGTGHLGVTLPHGLVHAWLEHLTTTMPHLLVDKLSPTNSVNLAVQQKSYGPAYFGAGMSHSNPDRAVSLAEDYAAAISYTFDYRLVEASPLVTQVIDRALHAHHRIVESHESLGIPVPPNGKRPGLSKVSSTTHMQMDGELMADLLTSLIDHLKMDKGYTISVLNPRKDWIINSLKYVSRSVRSQSSPPPASSCPVLVLSHSPLLLPSSLLLFHDPEPLVSCLSP